MTLDYDRFIREESARFAAAVSGAHLDADVPSCPEWSVADLVWHLAEVQGFWATIVGDLVEDPDQVAAPERPADGELQGLFDQQSARLRNALADRDDADACWTWASDRTVGFVRRRQAHEAAIHRVDAELAAGHPVTPLDAALAGDGIAEVLQHMTGGPIPEWATLHPEGRFVRLVDEAGNRWTGEFARFTGTSPVTGTSYDLDHIGLTDGDPEPDATISGTSDLLDRWLWGRADLAELRVEGDRALVDRLRASVADSTQ